MAVKIDGMDSVLNSLNKEVKGIAGKTKAGLRAGALIVQRKAQKRAPADTGNLRGSAYTEVNEDFNGPFAIVGFMAAYALFVHENMEQKLKGQPRTSGSGRGTYWESGEPKFLESALRDSHNEIISEIIRRAKV